MLLYEFLKEHEKVEELTKDFQATIARQQKQIDALTAGLQKVSAQLPDWAAQMSPSRLFLDTCHACAVIGTTFAGWRSVIN